MWEHFRHSALPHSTWLLLFCSHHNTLRGIFKDDTFHCGFYFIYWNFHFQYFCHFFAYLFCVCVCVCVFFNSQYTCWIPHPCCWLSHPGLEFISFLYSSICLNLFWGNYSFKKIAYKFFVSFQPFKYVWIWLLSSYELLEESYDIECPYFLFLCCNLQSVGMGVFQFFFFLFLLFWVFLVGSLLF
jgi:hypothetical protein